MVKLQISKVFLDKIETKQKEFDDNNDYREFGGWLMIKKAIHITGDVEDVISDIYFDEAYQDGGIVQFGTKILDVPEEQRKTVKGWFHRHPINDMSGLDISTATKLTKFWGECITVVLLGNDKLLIVKSEQSKGFNGEYKPKITYRTKVSNWKDLEWNFLSKLTGKINL